MKLCFLAGADSIHSKKWIEYFDKRGHETHWITLVPNIFKDIKNIKLYLINRFPGKLLNILLNAIPVRRLIKKINPDILHAHYAGINGVLAALSGFHPFVLTVWGSDVLIAGKSKIKKSLVKFALNKADLITCDAEHMKEAMIKLGIASSKIKIIRFGIDTKKFSPGKKNNNSSTVISLRSLVPIYDLETLIKAVPLVLKEFPEAKFIIIGEGSEEKKLKEMAENLGILENIKFIGSIPNDKIPQYLREADVYVSTALSDAGIAASTAEAMACGLAIVITDSGENKKWVKDGENGFIIPVKSPEILAEKINYLLKNKEIRRKFGEINRKIIEERNNYYKEMEKVESIYKGLVDN